MVASLLKSRGLVAERIVHAHTCTSGLSLVLLLLVTGCATYQDRPLSKTETLDDYEARTLALPDLQAYVQSRLDVQQWPPAAWSLPELTLAAFYYSPQLDVARAQWAAVRGGRQVAAERPNPAIGLTPGFNSTTGYGADISPWIVGVALDLPIETAGKRGYRIAQAEQLSEAARLRIAQVAWELRRQVRQTLLDLYGASQTAALYRRGLAIQDDNVQLLEQMADLGEISANELSQARALRDELSLAALEAGKQESQARIRLAGVVGVPARELRGEEFSFEAFEALPVDVPPVEAQRQALLNRPDLLAALAEYEASQSALRLEVARQYPDIQIGPGYEFDQSENKWMLGLSVTLPVFNRNQGAIAVAEANRAQAQAQFMALQARIVGELESALGDYQASMEKLRVAENLAANREAAASRTEQMYELGEIVRSQVDAAALEANTAALNRLEARIEALRAVGQIEDAMHVATDMPNGARQVWLSLGLTENQEDLDHEQ